MHKLHLTVDLTLDPAVVARYYHMVRSKLYHKLPSSLTHSDLGQQKRTRLPSKKDMAKKLLLAYYWTLCAPIEALEDPKSYKERGSTAKWISWQKGFNSFMEKINYPEFMYSTKVLAHPYQYFRRDIINAYKDVMPQMLPDLTYINSSELIPKG